MRTKALYIAFQTLEAASGITNKIYSQYRGLVNSGLDTSFCHIDVVDNNWRYVVDGKVIGCIGTGFYGHVAYYFSFNPVFDYIKENEIGFIYIRYTQFATPFFVDFLRKVHKLGVRIFMEIPTWPYDTEYVHGTILNRLQRWIERKSRVYFKKYVDRVVTVQDIDEIMTIPTIKISNGIDVESITLRSEKPHEGINLLGVAHLGDWHGYDRLIEGMGLYYKETSNPIEIHFYIVGDNEKVYKQYLTIAKNYGIENRIHFEGIKGGEELDNYFDTADLAIGCLGNHRKGVKDAKPLKSIEYAARGIPFIYSERNSDFDNRLFVVKFPQDDTPISVDILLDFIENNHFDPSEIRKSVTKTLSWDYQMSKITSELILKK